MSLSLLGMHQRLTYGDYAALPATNISRLKEMARSPLHYLWRLDNPRASEPLRLGSSAHTAVLEPHRFLAEYCLWDERTEGGNVRPRRGKDWEAFCASNKGKTPIKSNEYGLAMSIRDAVRGGADSGPYLRKGDPEVSMVWHDAETERVCKGRVDWLTRMDGVDVLVGLKTAADCRPIGFGNAAARLGYHLQWGFYRDGFEAVTGRLAKMVEIVVESAPPHDVAVYVVPSDVIEQGRDEYRKLLLQLAECEQSKRWPGAAPGEQILSLPSWVYHAQDDISDLGLEA